MELYNPSTGWLRLSKHAVDRRQERAAEFDVAADFKAAVRTAKRKWTGPSGLVYVVDLVSERLVTILYPEKPE